MKYKEALEIVNENINLIGKSTNLGLIDEIVIYPTDENLKEEFKKIYVKTGNAYEAINPYINEDVEISAIINKELIIKQKIFFSTNLENIKQI